ncbi:MAG TPA: hypothetical protein VGP72_20400 [Planctomycetota bacterium]|jgi:hypothetical protein
MRYAVALFLGALACFPCTLWAAPAVNPLEAALAAEDLDVAACQSFKNGKAAPIDAKTLQWVLGLPVSKEYFHPWSAGQAADDSKDGDTFSYLVAFKSPVAIGSLLFTTQQAALLKADAPYPPDPSNPAQWAPVAIPPSQGAVRGAALPQAAATRAVLFIDVLKTGRSCLSLARIFKSRLHNIASLASARAKTEYVAPESAGGRVYRAANLVRGRGTWQSNGKNDKGNVIGAFITEENPSWFVLGWDEPQRISAIYLQDNFGAFKLDAFSGPATMDPQIGLSSEWTPLKDTQFVDTKQHTGRWIAFPAAVETRGLRIRILKALAIRSGGVLDQSQVASIDSLLVLCDLGAQALPALREGPPPPPCAIHTQMEQDGLFTLVVDRPDGTRARNLVARADRRAGEYNDGWDLKDEAGKLVPPGTYRWKGIAHPPLKLRYEMTVYPNVTDHHPENSAWLNGPSGPGGWLADHSPPFGGCAAGDRMYFGATCPESGVGFVACDLSGRKLWGIHSFDAWSGAKHMTADGNTIYVENNWGGGGMEDIDRVWAVDAEKQTYRTLLKADGNENRRRGISGMAARGGKLYLAIRAKENWLATAANAAAVDVATCIPFYAPPRKPKLAYEVVPDSRDDFLRLFRLKGNPPGYGHPRGHGLIWLESDESISKRARIMLTFLKPVEIGCCVFPVPQAAGYTIKLSAARPDAPYPPSPTQKAHWIPFETSGKLAWDVALAPPNCSTRALLITFDKGTDELDEAAELDAARPARTKEAGKDDLLGDLDKNRATVPDERPGNTWHGQLEGMRILRRRFRNVAESAKVQVNSGAVDKTGVWDAKRTEPLSLADPAIYLLEWSKIQKLRGMAIKEIDGSEARIDVWTGPADGAIPLSGDANWKQIATYVPRRRMQHSNFQGHNALALYMDDTLDFGEEVQTRALRIRVVAQWATNTREGSCAKDQLGLSPSRCRIFGVAPLEYAGGETPIDPLSVGRLEVLDSQSGKIERDVPLNKPGYLAFAPDGTLYAGSDDKLVRIALAPGSPLPREGEGLGVRGHSAFSADVKKPGALACDNQGNVYVFDGAPERRNVRVYDRSGKFLHEVGEPGGYVVGPWTQKRMNQITALAIDKEDKLWAVDTTYFPKRVSCWKTDGTFLREYLGPTCYGSAGVLDPADRRRLFYGPMEFEIDWEKGTSRLKNLTWPVEDGWAAGEVPIHIGGRTYLVTRPNDSNNSMACGIVYLYEKDHLKRVAAMGHAAAFKPLSASQITGRLGGKTLVDLQFLWTDKNADGEVQFEECEFKPRAIPSLTQFNRDLGIQASQTRFEVNGFLPSGAPVYVEKKLPLPLNGLSDAQWYRLNNGNFYKMGSDKKQPETVVAPDGRMQWTYKQEGSGVGPNLTCGPYTPEQIVCQFYIVGHETAAAGDLGEFYVINGNLGAWNIWTADGLLAGRIFRDLRDPQRVSWTLREHARGMALDDVTSGQEHFQGWFCRTDNGKYYAVAGHNHASIVEVQGIDRFRRSSGTVEVTAEELRKAQEWEKEIANYRAHESAKVIDCGRSEEKIEPDGNPKEWANIPASHSEPAENAASGRDFAFRMSYDAENLYLLYEVRHAGPFKNTGNEWDKLFKTGACVDLMIACDEKADPARKAPTRGDKRLLLAPLHGQPVAVLYDAVNPQAPAGEKWEVVSPVARAEFDSVKRLADARVAHRILYQGEFKDAPVVGYIVEAAVPLKSLGLKIHADTRLKLDWGVLETDAEGAAVLARNYWANKATSTLADAPSEARLTPNLWGWVRFSGQSTDRDKPPLRIEHGKDDVKDLKLEE